MSAAQTKLSKTARRSMGNGKVAVSKRHPVLVISHYTKPNGSTGQRKVVEWREDG